MGTRWEAADTGMGNISTLKYFEFAMPADNLEDNFQPAICYTTPELKKKSVLT